MCIEIAPLTSMLKILSDSNTNHTVGISAKINKSLQLSFKISFLMTLLPNY